MTSAPDTTRAARPADRPQGTGAPSLLDGGRDHDHDARAAQAAPFVRLVVFFGGVASVGIELSASRLIAPFFGSSTFIWANLIGLTLACLALGYWLGGRVADRYPYPWLLFALAAVAAVAAGFVPVVARPILDASLRAFQSFSVGAFYGSLVAVVLLISLPVTLLGFVTPFALRLRLIDVGHAGNTAGNLYALSTVGSIIGSFLPVLLLIPWLGTARTFLVLALLLLLPALLGLVRLRLVKGAAALALLSLTLLGVSEATAYGQIRPAETGRLVYEQESEYNYIQVDEQNGRYLLVLNEGHAIHSIYDPTSPLVGGPWDYFPIAPLFAPGVGPTTVKSALLIGLAAGTAARELTAAYGPIPIDGVEIDPAIVAVGRRYFGMTEPNLNVIIADGRYALRTSDRRYDLIGVDAYRQPYIPFQLTTKEFFGEVAGRLTANGTAVVNVGRTRTDYRLVDVIASTMRAVFPHVYVVDVDGYDNSMVIGTRAGDGLANLAANAAALPAGSILAPVAASSLRAGNIREVAPGGRVFTDDLAPVEWVIDLIILDVARKGEGEL